MESIRQYFKRTDKIYLLLCIFSSTMAVVALASWAAKQGNGFATDEITGAITGIGDYRRALVQAGAAVLGIVIALLLSCVDYRSLVKVWPVHVVLTWGLVLPTLVIRNVSIGPLTIGYNAGDTDNYSWYKLGGFTFQPTELAKISFILTFAMHLNNVRSRINEPKELAKLLLHLLVPIAIIHVQGDDGTAIIYGIIGCCMMFAAGLSWKYIFAALAAAGAAVAVAFAFFSDKIGKGYQWYRILAVLDPENTTGWAPSETVWKNIIYQQQRGEIALGSGGIFGNGLFSGRYYSVPNAHNDFILSWIGNVAGFVGCCVVLGVLLALVIKTFATGARSEDLLGSYICAGIGGALMAQIAVKYADTAIFTSDNPRHESPGAILDEMAAGLDPGARFLRIVDRAEAIRTAAMLSRPGDILLIAGKGHETYQIIGDVKHHFDDKEEVGKAFGTLRN